MGIWGQVLVFCDGTREWNILFRRLRNLAAHVGRPVNLSEAVGILSDSGSMTRPPRLGDDLVRRSFRNR